MWPCCSKSGLVGGTVPLQVNVEVASASVRTWLFLSVSCLWFRALDYFSGAMSARCHAPHHDDHGLTPETPEARPQLNFSPLSCLDQCVSSQKWNRD